MSYEDRCKIGNQFANALFDEIEKMGITVALNGTEHTHPHFIKTLKQSIDQTSLAIRYQPDGVAQTGLIPRCFYIEAKAAKNIEKNAYIQYMKLWNNGNIVIVVFEKLNWGWNVIDKIRFIDPIITVSQYPAHRRFPIVDGWIDPRASPQWEQMKHKVPDASGTPYLEINPEHLIPWKLFKNLIKIKLNKVPVQTSNNLKLSAFS